MITIPEQKIPISYIDTRNSVNIYLKREDLIHQEISGNKYWKLFYNVNSYIEENPKNPLIITFGGAYSNHIAAVAALGKESGVETIGIIRGEELDQNFLSNPTLKSAHENEMDFAFFTREEYRDKDALSKIFKEKYQNALIIPEGGTNELAVQGIKHMLDSQTKDFHYLCTAVGTGGTVAGLSSFCQHNQRVIGFKVVKDNSLEERVFQLSGKRNFQLYDASQGGYGKISDEITRFINDFYLDYGIPLDPIYTGKMMMGLFKLADEGFFPKDAKVLAFHTGGLQGIGGANEMLKRQQRGLINFT